MEEWITIQCCECEKLAHIRQIIPFGWIKAIHRYYCRTCAILFDIDRQDGYQSSKE